jgi:hypothetical protein
MLNRISKGALILSILIFVSCGKSPQQVYQIPKEVEKAVNMPTPNSGSSMASGNVPGASASTEVPDWTVPEGWSVEATNNIRRGSFLSKGNLGEVMEISVTVFPGSVGGLLANVNRWAGQISMPPMTEDGLASIMKSMSVDGKESQYVKLDNIENGQGILAVIVSHKGNSWFFKATGPMNYLASEESVFLQYINSVKFK